MSICVIIGVVESNRFHLSASSLEKLSPTVLSNTSESSDTTDLDASLSMEISEIMPTSVGENGGKGTISSKQARAKKAKKDAAAKIYKDKITRLKAANPPIKVLVKDIRMSITKQMDVLLKDEKKARKLKVKGFVKYNDIISQMRSLRKVGSSLLYKTYEDLKIIWLKMVHDIV